MPEREAFLFRCVSLDLEVHPDTEQILQIGAVAPSRGQTLRFQRKFNIPDALRELDAFCQHAGFLLGHNISRHDIPLLKRHFSHLRLLSLPLLDTLFLSPLAFPKNPYHRLVKDYKLVKQARNDPVEDARCALTLFRDQWEAFAAMEPELLGLYGRLLSLSYPDDAYESLFQDLTRASLPAVDAIRNSWKRFAEGKVCQGRVTEVFDTLARQSDSAACLAYILAWIRVAGASSVLPPWVRHQFPQIPSLLDRLRGAPCLDTANCAYCRKHHDPIRNLERYFGYNEFRALKDEQPPLQEQVVADILRGNNCLAVLPTGYGKSVCYQLPSLMKARQRNQLSLIISPLQSLMKDQVDGMKGKGMLNVGTINGMLTMLERRQTLEDIRLGNIDLLWLAPEQLRNFSVKSTIKQREVGMVIVDEAHCFSKWGHDFRPDYLYLARFLKELCPGGDDRLPQVACFTATAKQEVIKEICAYFKDELGLDLTLFLGGHERENLTYIAESVREHEKEEIIHERLTQVFQENGGEGGGIVFAATRKRVETFSKGLEDRGWAVDFFHAGRTPEEKKQVQERFLLGELQVIVATNAFGMGIDKPDVRVVIHADVPGSLENYLQEAGRAGRDGEPSQCYLLFANEDLETQFQLSSHSRIEWRDMSGMLTGLKCLASRNSDKTVILTSGELLRSDAMQDQHLQALDVDEPMYDTKVKTALAWLEKSGKLRRGDNRTQVIQGKVLIDNLEQATQKIRTLKLPHAQKQKWIEILEILMQADPKELLNTDRLSLETGLEPRELLSILHSMREAGVVNHDLNMTAYVHKGVADDSTKRLQSYLSLEKAFIALMQEQEAEVGPDQPCSINLRSMSQALKDAGETEARPDRLLMLLDLLVQDQLLRRPSPLGSHSYRMLFRQDWTDLTRQLAERNAVCWVLLDNLLARLPSNARGKDLLVSFRSGELTEALSGNISTAYLNDPEKRIQQGLLALHAIRVICVQSGLTVFRPAMTICVTAESGERFTQQEYRPLKEYYREKTIQVHVIGRYAEMALESIQKALKFVTQYFGLDHFDFLRLHFKDQQELLELPTTSESYSKIVNDLQNPAQEQIVTAPLNKNLLIVAGPGSGKTRTLVHRIAYLVRVERIPASQILAIAFNRSAVTQLKLRLKALIGKDASWLRVRTYHSLAMSITGRSFTGKVGNSNDSDVFQDILQEAVDLLEEEAKSDYGALNWRDTLLSGLRFILVDEYQDIDELEYRFLSLLAGRNEQESGRRPSLLAVGDDDQNIYAWKGSHLRFIRRFQEDYNADMGELSKNYRSTSAIVDTSNALIAHNAERMKSSPIVSSAQRCLNRNSKKVTLLGAPDHLSVLKAALLEARKLTERPENPVAACDICLLCRTNRELYSLQILGRQMRIPLSVIRRRNVPLTLTREFQMLMNALNESVKEIVKGESLVSRIEELIHSEGFSKQNIWIAAFRSLLDSYLAEILDRQRPVGDFLEYVYDQSRDSRQFQHFARNSILLATMHAAKGQEFPIVIVAGQPLLNEEERDDERRLYYVAMTRAMHRLYCLHHRQTVHPFIPEIASGAAQSVEQRFSQPEITPEDHHAYQTQLWELELSDVVISFPAYQNIFAHAQRYLTQAEPGSSDKLQIRENGKVPSITWNNRPIAKFSTRGAQQYAALRRQGYVAEKILFLAAIHWKRREDSKNSFHEPDVENWYTGLFQIVLAKVS